LFTGFLILLLDISGLLKEMFADEVIPLINKL
jgi:hypothetical protein